MRLGEKSRVWAVGLCALLAVAAAGSAAVAQQLAPGPDAGPAAPAHFEVTVLRATAEPGAIDAQAARLHRLLSKRGLAFGSLRVTAHRQEALRLGQIGAVMTPNGKEYRFRPLDRSASGFLVAIDWGSTRGDFRMEPGVPLILGGQPNDGGQLVVVLELN